jgi:hypothetical protein
MRKAIAVLFAVAVLAIGVRATERLVHRVKVTQVNEWQAIVSCRNGRAPSLNPNAVAGVVIVSCEGREEE